MGVLCYGNCHVYLTGQARCTCGQAANTRGQPGAGGYTPTSGVAMYGSLPYNPFGHHAPTPTAPDVPLAVFRAARDTKATHLSADGLIAYDERSYGTWRCFWNEETRNFGSWYRLFEGLPADAVLLDKE